MCYLRLLDPMVTHTQEKRVCSTLSSRASFSREFGHRDKKAEKLQLSTLTLKGASDEFQKTADANTLIMLPYMHRKQGVCNYVCVCASFSGVSGPSTSKMKMCVCALNHLNVASGWPPNSSDTFNTSMRP